jgi:excisionase family DNA binding protein
MRIAGAEIVMEPIAISVADTIKALSLGRTKIYELINDGRLTTFKVGRRTLVKVDSIHALANIREQAAP